MFQISYIIQYVISVALSFIILPTIQRMHSDTPTTTSLDEVIGGLEDTLPAY